MGDNVLEGGMDTMSGKRISVSRGSPEEQCSSSSTRLRQTVHCTDECITEGGRSSPQSTVGRGGEACCLQLNPAQAKYTATEKECLAVVLGLYHFSIYLLGTRFRLETDHKALTKLRTMTNKNDQLMRWSLAYVLVTTKLIC